LRVGGRVEEGFLERPEPDTKVFFQPAKGTERLFDAATNDSV
jgi:hypothetical protein